MCVPLFFEVVWLNVRGGKLADYPVTWQVPMQADNTQPVVRKLAQGWNQTRLPVASSTTIAQFVHGSPIERIFYYQASEDRWYRWYKGLEDEPGLNTLKTIEPERVYWVLSGREALLSQASGVTSERFFLHNNHLGSVSFTTDVDGGVVAETLYQPYGGQFGAGAVDGEKVPYSFTGKELDGSGFYYFEARFYDPVTTRFVSPDPLFASELEKCVGSVVECNLYQYTGNNPVGFVDPSGTNAFVPSFGAINLGSFNRGTTDKHAGMISASNDVTIAVAIDATLAVTQGIDISKGYYFTTNNGEGMIEIGTFTSSAGIKIDTQSSGYDMDVSLILNVTAGSKTASFEGKTSNLNMDVGTYSLDLHGLKEDNYVPDGFSLGIGTPFAFGPLSVSETTTETTPLWTQSNQKSTDINQGDQ